MVIIFKMGNKEDIKDYRPIEIYIYKVLIKVLTKRLDRRDTRRKPATRANWIQKQIFNDKPHTRRKATEGEVQRM